MLGLLVTFPFVDQTFVTAGHTVRLGMLLDDGQVLTHVLLMTTLLSGHREIFEALRVEGEPVQFLWPIPITLPEVKLKQTRGLDALLDLLDQHKNPLVHRGGRQPYT